ncbi:MAG: hypothetical protein OXE41_11890 [Gammaproteobacteria bacterium]|nr:hypothetical protein [Gammaproteobacteria bacterium]MCY4276070.1 hypothetical protein [Gammaproteobacteria bacterium]
MFNHADSIIPVGSGDFDELDGNCLELPNVFTTDAYDPKSQICRTSSLRNILAEFGSAEKIKRFEDKGGQDVRTALLDATPKTESLAQALVDHGAVPR